jgi:N utilization substance protein A
VLVPEEQLSLAIGKRGQNVRLSAKLTGWKIDIIGVKTEESKAEGSEETSTEAVTEETNEAEAAVVEEVKAEETEE